MIDDIGTASVSNILSKNNSAITMSLIAENALFITFENTTSLP